MYFLGLMKADSEYNKQRYDRTQKTAKGVPYFAPTVQTAGILGNRIMVGGDAQCQCCEEPGLGSQCSYPSTHSNFIAPPLKPPSTLQEAAADPKGAAEDGERPVTLNIFSLASGLLLSLALLTAPTTVSTPLSGRT